MTTAKEVADAIVASKLWPGANPATVLMLCFLAEAEGHHPAVVYRDYHIMSGKPSKKAEAILRDFIEGGGKVEWHALDDKSADATFVHPSAPKGARITWTLDRAQKAGVSGNAMWKKYPRQMLRSRCISEGVRTVYPGATSGLYEEGEVADIVAETQPAAEVQTAPQEAPPSEYAFPEGPATGITMLKTMVRELWRDVNGCGDEDTLEALLAEKGTQEIMEQCDLLTNPAHREIWAGDGKDNPGLFAHIQKRRAEFATQNLNAG